MAGGGKHFYGRRWLMISLRSVHLAGVVLVGLVIVGAGSASLAATLLMLSTGFALYALELAHHRDFWKELAGLFGLIKLATLAAMLLWPFLAAPLFWAVIIASSVVSHAPYELRHRRVIG